MVTGQSADSNIPGAPFRLKKNNGVPLPGFKQIPTKPLMFQALSGLDQLTLPIMPHTAEALRRLLGRGNTLNQDYQAVMVRDPAAMIALYRRIGQANPNAADSITDASHAISLLGLENFRQLVEQLPVVATGQTPFTQTPALAYSEAAHAAFFARELHSTRWGDNGNDVPIAALLQHPAILALWVTDHESALRASNATRDGVSFDLAFSAELGRPLTQVERDLAESWSLPRLVRDTIGDSDNMLHHARSVRLAENMAQVAAAGWPAAQLALVYEQLGDYLKVESDAAASWWNQRAVDAARSLSGMGYPLAITEALYLPAEDRDEDIPLPRSWRVRQKPDGTPGLQSVLTDIMRRIQQDIGAKRVVFGMIDKQHTRLQARMAVGGSKEDPIRKYVLSLADQHLFSLLMKKPQAIWYNNGNSAKYRQLMPEQMKAVLSSDGFYAMSLFVKNRPIGMLYADGDLPGDDGYRLFRRLCNEAGAALAGKT